MTKLDQRPDPDLYRALLDALQIDAIVLSETTSRCSENPWTIDPELTEVDLNYTPRKTIGKEQLLHCTIRFSLVGRQEEKEAFRIEAEYRACYTCKEAVNKLDATSLDYFSLHNVPYNTYPYFREHVAGMMNKMGLAPITLPLFKGHTHG